MRFPTACLGFIASVTSAICSDAGRVIFADDFSASSRAAEFGCQRQLPGTDTTVKDINSKGAPGEGMIPVQALMRQWVSHRIEISGQRIVWRQNGIEILAGNVATLRPGGFFGIHQRYERGTRYDDVRIVVLP